MNTLLLLAALATIVFMFLQDIFGTSLVVAESRELKFWPGLFDGLGDLVSRYGVVIAAVAAVHFGLWSWQTALLAGLTAITSFFTSNLAVGKASKLLPKSRLEQLGRKAKKAELALVADLTPTTTTKKGPTMFDLSALENRFRSVELDAEEALHSKVATAIEDAAKIILPFVPDGSAVDELLAKFDELAAKAHSVVVTAAPVVTDAEAVTAEAPGIAGEVAAEVTGDEQPPTA